MYVSIKNRSLKICLCVCVGVCECVCDFYVKNFIFFLFHLLGFFYDFLLSNFAAELAVGGFDFSTVVDFVVVAALDFLQSFKTENRLVFLYNNQNDQFQDQEQW